jgi:hypothetical protein
MKNPNLSIKVSLIIGLIVGINSLDNLSLAKDLILLTQANSGNSGNSSGGTNKGSSTPGGVRNPESNCPATAIPLIAVNHNQGSDLTIYPNPTLWFYIPYNSEQISQIQFLLLDERERKTIYTTKIMLKNKPGFIKIKIPLEFGLQENQQYRWRLNLDCQPDETEEPDVSVDGWIKRVSVNPEMKLTDSPNYTTYRENGLWHDAITNLAESHFADPENENLTKDWSNLLQDLNIKQRIENENGEDTEQNLTREQLENLAQQPLADLELLPAQE